MCSKASDGRKKKPVGQKQQETFGKSYKCKQLRSEQDGGKAKVSHMLIDELLGHFAEV